MHNIIVDVHYVENFNSFLYLSPNIFAKFDTSTLRCVKGIVVKTQDIIYFSVSSDVCRKLPDGSVGISPLYASALQLSPKDKIVLTILDSAPSLSKITAHPYSEDDHQILEIASTEVEASLLNQIRIVWPKQCFPVWISPTISVKLIVDSIHPEVNFGTLVENTELIIGDAKQSEKCLRKIGNSCEAQVTNEETSSHPDNVLLKSIICRLIPVENDNPPYHVKISSEFSPKWLIKSEIGSVYELLSSEEPYSKVYVSVEIEESTVPDIGSYKSLRVSQTVIHLLNLSYCSKALLSPVSTHQEKLTSILVSPCQRLKEKYPLNEVENLFRKKLSTICLKYGRCLLNSKGIVPLDKDTCVTVTLRPLNLTWAYVTLISLYHLPISVNSLESNNTVEFESISIKEHVVKNDYVGTAVSEINAIMEHSLKVKCGLNKKEKINNNFLLVGKSGSGKTHISQNIMNSLSKLPYCIHFETIDCTLLKGKRIENIVKLFTSHLNICKSKQPSVLLIENIEIICGTFAPELEKSEASFHIQRISQKVADILENFMGSLSVLIFATCSSISSVNGALFKRRGKSVFSTVVSIQPLTQEDRIEIMKCAILNRTGNTDESLNQLDLDYYSSLTDSYVPADLNKFIEKAIFEASQRLSLSENQPVISKEDLKNAYESTSILIHNKLKVKKKHDIKLSDVGGLKNVKEKLIEIVVWPSKYGALLNQCPLKKQTGVLIYGAPGTGKTMLARAIAHESNLNFITIKGPELMSKYIGESEEGVRRVFENAQAAKPSLLFFDEFESLAPRRGEEQTGVTDRVVNQLLTALDGVEPISGVTVIAASSRPDLIDPALLRPGRLSHHLFLSYPDKTDRVEILEKLTQTVELSDDVDFETIASLTDQFSGADLKGLLTTAQIQVLDREFDSEAEVEGDLKDAKVKICQSDILSALDQTKPSLSNKDRFKFDAIYGSFSKGRVPDVTKQRAIFA